MSRPDGGHPRAIADSAADADVVLDVSAGASLVEVGADWVLIDETTCRIEAINETGALLWQCFDGESPLGEICADLALAFDVEPAVVRADVTPLVDRLIELRFVRSNPDAGPIVAGRRERPEADP